MAILATQNFDNLTESQTINTAALGAPWSVYAPGTVPTAQASAAAHGARGAYIAPATQPARFQWDENQTTATRVGSWYFRILVDTAMVTYIGSISDGTSITRGNWRINADRTVTLRNGETATGGPSPQALAINTWYRAEWMTSTSGQELRVYEGESTTPYITRTGDLTSNLHTRISCGIIATPNGHSLEIDTIRIADDWLTPFEPPVEPPTYLINEPFEGGTSGATMTTSNTTATHVNGSIAPAFSSMAVEGNLSARFATGGTYSQLHFSHSPISVGWYSFYVHIASLPSAAFSIAAFNLTANNDRIGDLRVNTNGTLTLRNNSTAVLTSTAALTPGQWHRIAVRIEPNVANGLRLRMYVGANRHGTTPTYEGAANSTRDFPLNRFLVGVVEASDTEVYVDRIRANATSEPAGMDGGPEPEPPLNPYWLYDNGTSWVNVTPDIYYDNGTNWINIHSLETSANPPTTQPMLLGSCAGSPTTFASWNTESSNDGSKPGAANLGLGVHRTYSPGSIVSNFMSTAAAGDVANGVASMWSCKPNLDAVAAGDLDGTFISFFNSIPAGHRAYLMMWHEPWDDQFNWNTYRTAQARVWGLLHNQSTADTNLVSWGILGTSWDFIQGQAQANFFPSGGQFDWVGVDVYDMYRNLQVMPPSPRNRNGHQSPAQRLGPVVSFANSVGKPWVVGEFGMHPDPANPNGAANWEGVPSRPHRLASYIDYMATNGCVAAAWFHSSNGDDGPWWMNCFHNFDNRQDMSVADPDTMRVWRNYLAVYGKKP